MLTRKLLNEQLLASKSKPQSHDSRKFIALDGEDIIVVTDETQRHFTHLLLFLHQVV